MAEAVMQLEENSSTITVNTSRFGEMAVDPEKIITLTSALPGFPESRRFALRQHSSKSPFMWLQSLDNPELAFVVIQARQLIPGYRPELPAAVVRELGESRGGELDLLLILAIPRGNPEKMTANLLGPLVVNPDRRLARQVLLDPASYDPCWPVFEAEPDRADQ